jgi:hypothetical protein
VGGRQGSPSAAEKGISPIHLRIPHVPLNRVRKGEER